MPLTRNASGASSDGNPNGTKRPRRAAAKDRDYSETGSVTGEPRGRAAANKRAGKANKKRDERSMLAEIWMMKNEAGDKPSPELKEHYADLLKVRRELFWDLMKKYALKSRSSCVPDFEQIANHMKDRVELLQELRVQGVDFWWELDEAGQFYKPNTANLKNFKPASGLLHHFYQVFIRDPERYAEVRENRPPGNRYRVEPEVLDELVDKLSPFRLTPEPKALLVLPRQHHQLRGTYALTKKVAGHNVFVRLQRRVGKPQGQLVTVIVNGTSLEVPQDRSINYAQSENGLVLLCKEEKKAADDMDGGESYRDVPFRMRVPSHRLMEDIISDLQAPIFELGDLTVVPVRGLIPPPQYAGDVDYGAVWNGCFAPFPRIAASVEEFMAHFDIFPVDCFNYFFRPGRNGSEHVTSEEYIRFMTWWANFDDGMGDRCCKARALYEALSQDGIPFYLQSKNEELRSTQRPGAFAVRLSDTKAGCLTVEVLKEENEGSPFAVLCYRLRVQFHTFPAPFPTGKGAKQVAMDLTPQVTVEFALEAVDGSIAVDFQPRLLGGILQRIEEQVELPRGLKLVPYESGDQAGALLMPRPGTKRKRVAQDETVPPPMARIGMPGVSAFNNETFDISGQKTLAAAEVVREPSYVQGGIPPSVFGRFPEVGNENTLGSTAALAMGSREISSGISRDWSFGAYLRDISAGPLAREHSLMMPGSTRGFSTEPLARDPSLGLSRDMSLGLSSFDIDGPNGDMLLKSESKEEGEGKSM